MSLRLRSPAVPARRYVPALPTLDPMLLAPSLHASAGRRFPLGSLASGHLFYLARAGVFHAVPQLTHGRAGAVLMPAYHHGVEVEAVRAAGAPIVYYRVDGRMRLDLDDVAAKLRAQPISLVYVTHFVGFAQPVAEVSALCSERGIPLFEDCALALFSATEQGEPLGSRGDAAVFCLYKTLPVPHGGLLLGRAAPMFDLTPPPLASTLHHLAGLVLAQLELSGGAVGQALRQALRAAAHRTVDSVVDYVKTGTQHLRPAEVGLAASALVARLLERFDGDAIAQKRRHNFARLAEALDGAVEVIGHPLAPGVVPLFVPLRVQDKRGLQDQLLARGIQAVDFWSGGDPRCPQDEFPEVGALRREVLELPCHQSLDDDAIDFVARTMKRLLVHG